MSPTQCQQATKRSLTALHRLFEDMTSAFEARRGGGLPSVLLSTRYLFLRDPGKGFSSYKGVRCPMRVIARQLLSREVENVGGRRRSLETVSQTSQQNELPLSPAPRHVEITNWSHHCCMRLVVARRRGMFHLRLLNPLKCFTCCRFALTTILLIWSKNVLVIQRDLVDACVYTLLRLYF